MFQIPVNWSQNIIKIINGPKTKYFSILPFIFQKNVIKFKNPKLTEKRLLDALKIQIKTGITFDYLLKNCNAFILSLWKISNKLLHYSYFHLQNF